MKKASPEAVSGPLDECMNSMLWSLAVAFSRLRNRASYLLRAPRVYRNWWAIVLPKLGKSTVLELPNGSKYFVRPHKLDLAVVNEAVFLNPYLGRGHVSVAADAVVVDIGTNIGDFTAQVARLCPRGRVIAVEPMKAVCDMIATQVRLNSLTNVTAICAAVSGEDGETTTDHLADPYSTDGAGPEKVRVVTLETLMKELNLSQIELLKIDCEGAEWDILLAAEDVLPAVRQICMEFHAGRGWTAEKLSTWQHLRGFEVRHTNGSWNGLLWTRRP